MCEETTARQRPWAALVRAASFSVRPGRARRLQADKRRQILTVSA